MATQRMLKFVTVSKEMPEKRVASVRAQDFAEIYREFAAAKAAEQAARCSQCGVPYCQTHCPLHNNIPDWLRLTAEGRLQEAYELSQETNTFPEICGRICPQDRLCEGNCVIELSGHGTVTIGAVEKYLTDTAWDNGWVRPIRPAAERAESVGIIGAGPGGLAAADVLRRAGLQVTVYDRHDRAGGLLTYGIPGFKLEKDVVMQRISQLEKGGVEFVLNCSVGVDLAFDAIRGRHDAVIIATGVYRSPRTVRPERAGERHRAGDRLPDRLEPQEFRRRGARVRQRRDERRGQARRRHRRRRYRDGLRAHRDPPGCAIGEMPLPPRPGQHARQPARGRQCRGRGRRVRLADRAARLCRRGRGRGRDRAAHAARRARCHAAASRPR